MPVLFSVLFGKYIMLILVNVFQSSCHLGSPTVFYLLFTQLHPPYAVFPVMFLFHSFQQLPANLKTGDRNDQFHFMLHYVVHQMQLVLFLRTADLVEMSLFLSQQWLKVVVEIKGLVFHLSVFKFKVLSYNKRKQDSIALHRLQVQLCS